MGDGIAAELDGIDLGDERLNRRSKQVLEALAANPEASVNAACDGWGDTLAAYRLFDNAAVAPEKILEPHRLASMEWIRAQPVALVVQDTTELDFTAHPPRDARCLNRPGRRPGGVLAAAHQPAGRDAGRRAAGPGLLPRAVDHRNLLPHPEDGLPRPQRSSWKPCRG